MAWYQQKPRRIIGPACGQGASQQRWPERAPATPAPFGSAGDDAAYMQNMIEDWTEKLENFAL